MNKYVYMCNFVYVYKCRPFYTKSMKKKRAEKEALRLMEEAKRQVQNEIRFESVHLYM